MSRVSVASVIEIVAAYYSRAVREITGPARDADLVRVRQIAMWCARARTDRSTTVIGQVFGQRDHTTVMHASRKIDAAMVDDKSLAEELDEIMSIIDGVEEAYRQLAISEAEALAKAIADRALSNRRSATEISIDEIVALARGYLDLRNRFAELMAELKPLAETQAN